MRRVGPWGVLALLVANAACSSSTSPPDDGALRIAATTSIVGDVVSSLAGPAAEVEVLMGANVDPHTFSPSAADVAAVRSADLVVASGLGLEAAMTDVLRSAEGDGVRVVRLGDFVDVLPLAATDAGSTEDGQADPHFWLDPLRMAVAVDHLGEILASIDPPHASEWRARAAGYRATLEGVDARIADLVASVPRERRLLVTNHDSLGYFAERYGFDVVGTVIPGATTNAEPSAADLAELIDAVEATGVPAIFAESTRPTRLADLVAAEVGREVVVVQLFTGALGEAGSGAETYPGLLTTDAERIVRALSG